MSTKTTKKTNVVGLKELREHMETFIKRVQAGESLTVIRRNQPVFRITPISTESVDDWESVIDFTKINPNGVSAKELLASLRQLHG